MADAVLTIDDIPEVRGKRVFVRVDFNVPMSKDGATIKDDFRIRSTLPTIENLAARGARLILASHLGRPSGKGPEPGMSLAPCAKRLKELLPSRAVTFAPDCLDAAAAVAALKDGDIVVLENLRFYPGEGSDKEAERAEMAARLAAYAEVYVCDAFGTAHRDAASITGVPKVLGGGFAGYLMAKEVEYLSGAIAHPQRPFVAIVGGAKVSDKISVLLNLVAKCDTIVIGGAMAYSFLAARGVPVGGSKCERTAGTKDILKVAADVMAAAEARGVRIVLPLDHACGTAFAPCDSPTITDGEAVPDGVMALDIGPKTITAVTAALADARTVVWNGPMGAFELKGFEAGTFAVARALAAQAPRTRTIVGGGDSAAAAEVAGVAKRLAHVSTGGGASLELLEGKVLPGVAALSHAPVPAVGGPRITLRGGARMPAVGLGTWKIPKAEAAAAVERAIRVGYRLIDCACDYGNEVEVGAGIAAAIKAGVCTREELFVTSKLWPTFLHPDNVEEACRKTLADLGVGYLDLYLIHFPIPLAYVAPSRKYPPGWFDPDDGTVRHAAVPLAATWKAMEAVRGKGLARHIGVSNFNYTAVRDLMTQCEVPPFVNQIELHPYLAQPTLVAAMRAMGVAVTAYSSFGSVSYDGLGIQPKDPRVATATPLLSHPTVAEIATKHGTTAAGVLLAWAVGVARVAVIPKSSSEDRLRANLEAPSAVRLDAEDAARLAALDQGIRYNNPADYLDTPIFA